MSEILVCSPLDGSKLGSVEETSPQQFNLLVEEAKSAQVHWDLLGVKKRASYFLEYLHLLKKEAQELMHIIHKENGKTLEEAQAEVEKAIELTEFACSMPQLMINQNLEVSTGVECTMKYLPLGVVASICPFNFPVMIPHWTMPIALMAGNSMILKPSEVVPLSSLKIKELLVKAGVPKGVFHLVHGREKIVDEICKHKDIQAVSFVGSTKVAEIVYRKSTSHLKRALCLGGAKNHLLVLPDADPEMTAINVVASMSGMAGQRCMAASVMVGVGKVDHIIKEIVKHAEKIVCGVNLGAIISKQSKERIESYIDLAQAEGAKILLNGKGAKVQGKERGFYVGPTVIDHVGKTSKLAQDEIFGPILTIIRAENIEEAIQIQNANPYGNGASVYTNSGAWAKYVSDRLTAGMVGVNIGVPVPREPFSFGGTKASKFGVGDITGESSIRFWTQMKKYTTKWNKEAGVNWMS
jgi:malonate-semialdehyde dehydrogenase (acetylating)/methylmalonate-semialdehyde dehydrogenase